MDMSDAPVDFEEFDEGKSSAIVQVPAKGKKFRLYRNYRAIKILISR